MPLPIVHAALLARRSLGRTSTRPGNEYDDCEHRNSSERRKRAEQAHTHGCL
jgi:hypothetical protein